MEKTQSNVRPYDNKQRGRTSKNRINEGLIETKGEEKACAGIELKKFS